jgi:histone deacetylase 11
MKSTGGPSIPRVLYTPAYDVALLGLERLHHFDGRKSTRALRLVRSALGATLDGLVMAPETPVTLPSLRLIHEEGYLASLRHSAVVSKVLEVGALRWLPGVALDRAVLRPMRWAVQGTIDATRNALTHGAAINLAGGYHHAHRDHGEGFCAYADIPIAIEAMRRDGLLSERDRVIIIDLDAHRGNGFESIYEHDERVVYFDLYSAQVYPGPLQHPASHMSLFGCRFGMTDQAYFDTLEKHLPEVLNKSPFALALYNAGTDVLAGDPLGGLGLTREAVLRRDRYVIESLESAGIPWVMVPSGGYTDESHRLLAGTVAWACGRMSLS